jgi:hypothetical protein
MTSLKTIIVASVLALLATAPVVTAAPYSPALEDAGVIRVYIRDNVGAFHHAPEMAHTFAARNAALPLDKRQSFASVQACYASDCTDCRLVFEDSYSGNTGCIRVENTRCLIVSNMVNANIVY